MAATVTPHNADVAERRITELEATGAITAPGIRKLRDELVAAGTYDDRAATHIIAACTEILIAVENDPTLLPEPRYPHYSSPRQFTARFRTVAYAQRFLEEVDRICATVEIGKATRRGREVTFTAYTYDSHDFNLLGDIRLSAGYYGGCGTYLNGQLCPFER